MKQNRLDPRSAWTKKFIIATSFMWLTILCITRIKHTVTIIPSSLMLNLYIFTAVVAIIFSINRLKIDRYFLLLILTLIFYTFTLIIIENLPLIHIVQLFLSVKVLFVFIACLLLPKNHLPSYWISFCRLLFFICLASFPFAVLDFIAPNMLYPLAVDGRGINGISAGSFFGSRVLYAGYLVFCLILLLTLNDIILKQHLSWLATYKYLFLVAIIIALVATQSRKEILVACIILTLKAYSSGYVRPLLLKNLIVFCFALCVILLFAISFSDSLMNNFNENYVRYKIFSSAKDIFIDHFPLGSGPGTFGSGFSKSYTAVYEEFNVPAAVTGYQGKFNGPIFDLYFISLFAEYGIGACLLLGSLFFPFICQVQDSMRQRVQVGQFRLYLAIFVVGIGFFVPVFSNLIGFISMIAFGLLAKRN
jgi:hypothetical protein